MTADDTHEFCRRGRAMTEAMQGDPLLQDAARRFMERSIAHEYSYHFSWLGRPIIQYPQDIVAIQEIIWSVKPDLVIETGVARGGSLILSASILQLAGLDGRVIGVDVDIRPHNRQAVEEHPLSNRIDLIEGSSTSAGVVEELRRRASGKKVMLFLDSNHTHEHVLGELVLLSPLVSKGSYLVVFDTIVEDLPGSLVGNRPWSKGNSPKTALKKFLSENDRFEVDREIEAKLQITVAPEGYLRCVKD